MTIQDTELLLNKHTSRYTLYRPRTGETRQTSFDAAMDILWLGVKIQQFNNRKELEEYLKSCKKTMLLGSVKDLGTPK